MRQSSLIEPNCWVKTSISWLFPSTDKDLTKKIFEGQKFELVGTINCYEKPEFYQISTKIRKFRQFEFLWNKGSGFEMTLISKIFKNHNFHNFHIALTIYYIHHVCYDFWCSCLITTVHEYDDFYAVERDSVRSVGLIYVLIIAFSIV